MIPIQEIDFFTDSNIKFSAHLIVPDPSLIGAEVAVYDPRINKIFSTLHPIGQQQSLKSAFEAIVDYCTKYAGSANAKIIKINNPCNTEFFDQSEQQAIIEQKGLVVKVEVNA